MKKLCLLVGLFTALGGFAWAAEDYPLGPDSQRQPGVPQGKVTQYTWTSKIFPGTVRDYWVYVPAQYTPEKPACVMLFEDGKGYVSETGRTRIPIVFDNLIAKHDMPVTIAILIDPGVLKATAPGQQDRVNRSYEYDSLSDRYARFLLDEILPEVAKHYNLSTNPNDRAISGGSSGGICSFTVAWTHPEAFRRVLSFIGSFTDLRGGDIYPALIRKTEPKPLRVFLQDGDHDLNNFAGAWWLANQSMASALTFAGCDVKFVTGDKDHDMIQGGAILPDALRWLWRDYPQPIVKPAMKPLGDAKTGFQGVDTEWEEVASLPETTICASLVRDDAAIATDQQGNVFTIDSAPCISSSPIYRIGVDGQLSTFVKDGHGTRGLAFGPDGRLYGCNHEGIVSYTPDGAETVHLPGVGCKDIAVAREGGIYFTEPRSGLVRYLPPANSSHWIGAYGSAQSQPLTWLMANGVRLSSDESLLYVSDRTRKWVWSSQVQADGSPAYGEPFFRLETLDESSEGDASGMAVDSNGLLYVATRMGIQICDQQGRVVAILNWPGPITPEMGPNAGVAFGGQNHQYLYAVLGYGNKVFRRHLLRRPVQP
jgi:enterochelin esterase-like enzyme/sugar lactone lactonase YvrE